MSSRIIRIEYNEIGDPDYSGITISDGENTVRTFMTGDVVADFADMKDWCRGNPFPGRYMFSSSVDHFTMDVPGYGWTSDDEGRDMLIRVPIDEQQAGVDDDS
ncbi:hypothetical protein [Rhizobium sp. BK176]|uniref:hypothetical protein n=1 Tax=Rhizobium sp. BK176 TaxID=2587071 RepID=UPI002169F0F6|nr:hypothetical protein [Rhizobium sp. BK176]MCS4089110.1 hypothetical protein [Rhizobium sp. BK176]